jgi:hypothetical protein
MHNAHAQRATHKMHQQKKHKYTHLATKSSVTKRGVVGAREVRFTINGAIVDQIEQLVLTITHKNTKNTITQLRINTHKYTKHTWPPRAA